MFCKNTIKELTLLIGIAIITAFAINHFSPSGIALFGEWDTSKGVITAKSKDDVVVREHEIDNVLLAKKMYDSGGYIFVDARVYESFSEGHIKGSISLPVGDFDDRFMQLMEAYPVSTGFITYCSGRECEDSHELAQYLSDAGYTNVKVFIDGYPLWKAEGYPIE